MFKVKEKMERSLGTRLFLKAHRCNSPKCAMIRKPHRPGLHYKKRRGGDSEIKKQLQEKQRVKLTYHLTEGQLRNIFTAALKKAAATDKIMLQILERRLVNVVYRLEFGGSRAASRQLIRHNHIRVNNKRTVSPAYLTNVGDVISWNPNSYNSQSYQDVQSRIEKTETPSWLKIDPKNITGTVTSLPVNIDNPFDISLIVEYYSK